MSAGPYRLAHPLWDKYLEFEAHSGNGTPAHVAQLYTRVLQVPLKAGGVCYGCTRGVLGGYIRDVLGVY